MFRAITLPESDFINSLQSIWYTVKDHYYTYLQIFFQVNRVGKIG